MLGQIRLSHELDAAWIIPLWKFIHGGDPTPEQVAVQAIAALATQVSPGAATPAREEDLKELQTRLSSLGLNFVERPAGAGHATEALLPPRFKTKQYCFQAPHGEACAVIRYQVNSAVE